MNEEQLRLKLSTRQEHPQLTIPRTLQRSGVLYGWRVVFLERFVYQQSLSALSISRHLGHMSRYRTLHLEASTCYIGSQVFSNVPFVSARSNLSRTTFPTTDPLQRPGLFSLKRRHLSHPATALLDGDKRTNVISTLLSMHEIAQSELVLDQQIHPFFMPSLLVGQ